jgi:hypothetical protein
VKERSASRKARKPTKDYVFTNVQCPKANLVVARHANIRVPVCGHCRHPLASK